MRAKCGPNSAVVNHKRMGAVPKGGLATGKIQKLGKTIQTNHNELEKIAGKLYYE